MRTVAVNASAHVAIMTQNTKTGRVVIDFQPSIDIVVNFLAVLLAKSINVIHREKFFVGFSTTFALRTTIVFEREKTVRRALLIKFSLIFGMIKLLSVCSNLLAILFSPDSF